MRGRLGGEGVRRLGGGVSEGRSAVRDKSGD